METQPKHEADLRLSGVSFRWSCWDVRDVVCRVAITSIERSTYLLANSAVSQLDRLQLPTDTPATDNLSLGIWACYDADSISMVCQAMQELSQRDAAAIKLCYISPELSSRTSIFIEAGAHMVVSHISDLANGLETLLSKSKLFREGNHPLTKGLINRLPWKSVAALSAG